MFITKQSLKVAIQEAFGEMGVKTMDTKTLKMNVEELEKKIRELEHKKSMEQTELEGLIKIKEEKLKIELEMKKNELVGEFQTKTMELQTAYHDKVLVMLEKHAAQFQETYKEIMERLPNVSVELQRKI